RGRGSLLAEEVGLEGMHAGDREQRRRIVSGGHERGRGDAQVPVLLEEGEVTLADLIRAHHRSTILGRVRAAALRGDRAVADEHGVGAGIGLEHVQGAGPADAYAAALADGEGVSALVLAQDPSLAIDDRARSRPQAAVALQEGALARAGEEAQVLGVLAVCDREAGALRDLAHARLVQPAERKAKARERGGRERGEHVALVLALVGGETEQP